MTPSSFSSFVALRYLKTNRENRFFSWISSLTTVGITIGVMAMIVVLSVINGFEKELRERFLAANAHILAYRFPAGIKDYDKWASLIGGQFEEDITGVSPFVHMDTMGKKDHIVHAILVKGIHPKERRNVQDVRDVIRPLTALDALDEEVEAKQAGLPLPETPGIILGQGLMTAMSAKLGDVIQLISPRLESDDPMGILMKFKIIGVYDSGLQHYDTKLGIMSIPAAQFLFNMGDIVTGIEIGLKDPDRSPEIAAKMQDLYDISIKEWQSYNQNIFEAMHNERTVIGLIVALVAFVASFNILTTLFVSVSQKQREISIFKSLGATNGQVLFLFLKQSFLMGLIGGVTGMTGAWILSYLLKRYQFVDLPDIYLLANLPILVDWRVYLGVTLAALGIALSAGFYPAWIATRVVPTQGLTSQRRLDT